MMNEAKIDQLLETVKEDLKALINASLEIDAFEIAERAFMSLGCLLGRSEDGDDDEDDDY